MDSIWGGDHVPTEFKPACWLNVEIWEGGGMGYKVEPEEHNEIMSLTVISRFIGDYGLNICDIYWTLL